MNPITAARTARAWRRYAADHDLTYDPAPGLPTGPVGLPYNRGTGRARTHLVTGPVPASARGVRAHTGAGVTPVTFTGCTFTTTLPVHTTAGPARLELTVVHADLPAPLPTLQVADRRTEATLNPAPPSWTLDTAFPDLHARFNLAARHRAWGREMVSTETAHTLQDLPPGAFLLIDGRQATLITPGAATPQTLHGRLHALCAVTAAIPAHVWHAAGLQVARTVARPSYSPGWRPGRRAAATVGPAWQ